MCAMPGHHKPHVTDMGRTPGRSDEHHEERFLRLARSELDHAYRLAGFLLGDAQEAEDATQEALIRAWRSIARFGMRSSSGAPTTRA